MENVDKIAYLANVLSIARADGQTDRDEAVVLQSVAERIGADQADLLEARKLLTSGAYKLRLLRQPSARLSNIEDMVTMALADGELSGNEAGPIEKLSNILSFSQADMDLLVRRAESRLKKLGESETDIETEAPPVPEQPAAPEAPPPVPEPPAPRQAERPPPLRVKQRRESPRQDHRFSARRQTPKPEPTPPSPPEPKEPTTPEPAMPTRPAFVIPASGVVIEVTGSDPAALQNAVEALAEAPASDVRAVDGEDWYYGCWADATPAQVAEVALRIGQETRRRIYVNGEQQDWEDVFGVARCIDAREASENPAEHCFGAAGACPNIWGCRLLGMGWTPSADWFSLGSFRDDRTFVFDKHAIAERLDEALGRVSACPHLQPAYIRKALRALPERASVLGRWQHKRVRANTPDAQTVTVREYVHGHVLASQAAVRGVTPTGAREAIKIIRRAAKTAGIVGLQTDLLEPTEETRQDG